jgi:hypothetical protein
MSKMPQSSSKRSNKSKKTVESRTLTKLWQLSLRLRSRIIVSLTLSTYWLKKSTPLRITTSTSMMKLLNISSWRSKMRQRKDEKFRSLRTKEMSWRKVSALPKVNVKIFKENLTWSKAMFKRWFKCSSKLVSNQTWLTSSHMTRIHNSTRTTLVTT